MTLLSAIAVAVAITAAALLAWWSSGPRDRPLDLTTPVRLFVLAYVAFYGVGSVLLLVAGESAGAGPVLAAVGLAAFSIGVALAARLKGAVPAMPRGLTAGRLSIPIVAGLAGVGLLAFLTIAAQSGIPLLARDPQASRAGFVGLWFDVFRWLVLPAGLVLFGLALGDGGRSRRVPLLAAGTIGATFLLLGGIASRALLFEFALELLLIVAWAGRRLPKRAWASIGAAGLVLFIGIQLGRVGPDSSFSGPGDVGQFVVTRTVNRVVLIHPRTLEIVASTIPDEEPSFGLSSYLRRLTILTGEPARPSLGYWIYERLFPGQPGGFAAPGVLGEAWANGGPVWVVLVMGLFGAGAHLAGGFLARLPTGAADRALAALVVLATARAYATSLNGMLLTLIVAVGWWLLARRSLSDIPIVERADRRTDQRNQDRTMTLRKPNP